MADRSHYGIPDVLGAHRARYAGKTTLVVGAGHSAANSILALVELARSSPGTAIRWATRSADLTRVFGGGDADGLPARGKLGSALRALIETGALTMIQRFQIDSVRERDGKLEVSGLRAGERFTQGAIDTIVVATGQRPDMTLTRELRLALDPALECADRARSADRSQRAQLRHGPAARRARAGASRAGLLHHRQQELRAGADLPARHRLRAGALGRRDARR